MTATVWTKFFWNDWESDPALRLCSLAAQGLWMRLLCLAAKSDPVGYVLVNGHPLDATGIARVASVTEGEVEILLSELERNGVFSRDRKGRMFSRRMVRDANMRAISQKNGKKGGNPSLCKVEQKHEGVNPPVKSMDNTHIPEANIPEKKSARSALCSVLKPETADAFIAHRKAKRSKLTDHAAELIANKLRGISDPDAVVLNSIANGWTGVFPDKSAPPSQQKPQQPPRNEFWRKVASK